MIVTILLVIVNVITRKLFNYIIIWSEEIATSCFVYSVFVGWFYKDADGTEHAFDFSMPVTKDLNLYAKWSVNTLVSYTIKYAVRNEDGQASMHALPSRWPTSVKRMMMFSPT